MTGSAPAACGVGGEACSNCSTIGDVCSQGACVSTPPVCTPTSCPLGCCDGTGVCQDGFLDAQCGSGGIACLDCTSSSTTCAVNQTPRGCSPTQTTCPAPYAGCPTGTVTASSPIESGACTPQDLTEAQAACAGGADTTGCTSFLQTLTSNGAQACALCLQPFVVPFEQGTGIFLCAAPFLSASCNQATGCFTDCETATCSECPASERRGMRGAGRDRELRARSRKASRASRRREDRRRGLLQPRELLRLWRVARGGRRAILRVTGGVPAPAVRLRAATALPRFR